MDLQKGLLLVFLVFVGWLISLLSPILMPFLAGTLFAYLLNPLIEGLRAWRLQRLAAVLLVLLGFVVVVVALMLLVVPMLHAQLTGFIELLPRLIEWGGETLRPIAEEWLGRPLALPDLGSLKQVVTSHWQQAGAIAGNIFGVVSRSGFAVFLWLANLVLIPLVMFYLLRDWPKILQNMKSCIPKRSRDTVVDLAKQCDEVLGAFIRGQLVVMVVLGAIYACGLSLAGISMGVFIGFLAGLLSIVPYLGFVVGFVIALVVALFQYADAWHVLYVVMVFGFGQFLEGFVLTPILVGDKIGLHPVGVIFAILAGGQLFGLVGTLLALPVAAVLMVLVRYAHRRYVSS